MYTYTTQPGRRSGLSKVLKHWRIQGAFRAAPQRPKVTFLDPKTGVDGCKFLFWWFFTDVATIHWRCQMSYFKRFFFKFKILILSSEFLNLSEVRCLRIKNRFKTNFHALKSAHFFLHKNINFGNIFDDLGGHQGRWQAGHFFHFFRKWIWVWPKNSGPNPRSFQLWGTLAWVPSPSPSQTDSWTQTDSWIGQCPNIRFV